mmetsp:Transcript_12669/g.17979  ORF Transcript_12669/g.17979 Transcript_12669/m.17979 type:complete len:332 (-) Transcript_12669:473-1468(-)
MFGLESIALAAEHLEKQARKAKQVSVSTVATVPDDSSSTMGNNGPPPPPPKMIPFGTLSECDHNVTTNKNAPRTVSLESIDEQELQQEEVETKKETTTMKVPDPPSPTDVIEKVLENDVLCGRGGETNHHPGNVRYRNLVKEQQILYLKAKRRDKPRIARHIVETVRIRGGRFLKKHTESGTWRDVGNNKAREKTSQALREGAPDLRVCKSNPNNAEKKQSSKKANKKRDIDTATSSADTAITTTTSATKSTSAVVSPTPSSTNSSLPSMNPQTSNISLPVIVSADDGSSDSASCYSSQDDTEISHRGPRLKRLKARLSITSSTVSEESKL